jgi:hypothetical protein
LFRAEVYGVLVNKADLNAAVSCTLGASYIRLFGGGGGREGVVSRITETS